MTVPDELDGAAAIGDLAPLVRGARIDHLAVAVRSLRDASTLFRDVLGGEFLFGAEIAHQAFRMAQYRLPGGGKFEAGHTHGRGVRLALPGTSR